MISEVWSLWQLWTTQKSSLLAEQIQDLVSSRIPELGFKDNDHTKSGQLRQRGQYRIQHVMTLGSNLPTHQ